jgi:hypothetical protein
LASVAAGLESDEGSSALGLALHLREGLWLGMGKARAFVPAFCDLFVIGAG